MNVNRILHIRDGDAVKTFQDFLAVWWRRVELDAMLAPVELSDHTGISPQAISQPAELSKVNPFAPVMLSNTASMVGDFIRDYPRSHLAVILRPCELRALVELQKRNRLHYHPFSTANERESLVIIGLDCPGTFSPAEYSRRVGIHQDDAKMIRVESTYSSQSSYIPREVRAACHMCISPSPFGADITIGTISLASQGDLLVIAHDENIDVSLKLREVTDDVATEKQVNCREAMIRKLVNKRAERCSDLIEAHARRSVDVNTALAMFARCTLCADCLDACPLYDGELSGMLGVGEAHQNTHPLLSELVSVSRWLASCSGCGMCQEACEHGVSLTSLITVLSHHLQIELHYEPGDPNQRLPWSV